MNRRRFFREGLRELLKPLAQTIEPLERAAHQLGALENAVTPKPAPRPAAPPAAVPRPEAGVGGGDMGAFLRPPGALEERTFREQCSRCGTCVAVCPVSAIKIDTSGVKGHGAPYIDPNEQACIACDGLYCMNNCPSGALVPTPLAEIDMGTADWQEASCLRTHGQNCTKCIDECPLGTAAIDLFGPRVLVKEQGCIGCGVCQKVCPTEPKSILVVPRAGRGE